MVGTHQDGRLYPGTGDAHESGKGAARGTKPNVPLLPGADAEVFMHEWGRALEFLRGFAPRFAHDERSRSAGDRRELEQDSLLQSGSRLDVRMP